MGCISWLRSRRRSESELADALEWAEENGPKSSEKIRVLVQVVTRYATILAMNFCTPLTVYRLSCIVKSFEKRCS